jgi:hypothetical protein
MRSSRGDRVANAAARAHVSGRVFDALRVKNRRAPRDRHGHPRRRGARGPGGVRRGVVNSPSCTKTDSSKGRRRMRSWVAAAAAATDQPAPQRQRSKPPYTHNFWHSPTTRLLTPFSPSSHPSALSPSLYRPPFRSALCPLPLPSALCPLPFALSIYSRPCDTRGTCHQAGLSAGR